MTATNICYNFVGFRCSPPPKAPNYYPNILQGSDLADVEDIISQLDPLPSFSLGWGKSRVAWSR